MIAEDCKRCHGYALEDQVWGGYSVAKALAILRDAPRRAVLLHSAQLNTRWIVGSVADTVRHCFHVDARRPCIAIYHRGKYVVIDGNHRATKQLMKHGAIRAYLLTAKEARRAVE